MIDILINGAIAIVSGLAGSWGGWFFARKKYNSEVDSNIIQNMEKSLEFYEKLSDDNKQRLDKALEDNAALRKSMDELLQENKQLRKEVEMLKDQVIRITTTICTDLSCQIRNRDYSTLNMLGNEESKPESV